MTYSLKSRTDLEQIRSRINQLTKAYGAETSCNQVVIDSATFCSRPVRLINSVAMSLYDIIHQRQWKPIASIKHGHMQKTLVQLTPHVQHETDQTT